MTALVCLSSPRTIGLGTGSIEDRRCVRMVSGFPVRMQSRMVHVSRVEFSISAARWELAKPWGVSCVKGRGDELRSVRWCSTMN